MVFTSHQLSRHSAMPRSFLVKSKKTHLLGPAKDSFRQRSLSRRDAQEPVTGKDSRHLEDAGQPSSPIFGVRDLVAEACSPWSRSAVRSHSDPTQDRWSSGMQQSSLFFCICVCACMKVHYFILFIYIKKKTHKFLSILSKLKSFGFFF